MEKYHFIINPKSGSYKGEGIIEKIKARFEGENLYIHVTEYPGHAKEIVKKLCLQKDLIIVAVGGDGTVNEIAEPMLFSTNLLGIIPNGSGNGLAGHMGINKNIESCIEKIKNKHFIECDVIKVNNFISCNTAGVGFDAYVAKIFGQDGRRGFSAYLRLGLTGYSQYPEIQVNFLNQTFSGLLTLEIANSSQLGNGAYISPNSSNSDGMAEIVLFRKPKFYQVPGVMYDVFTKKFDQSELTKIYAQSQGTIHLNRPTDLHIDGEYKGETDFINFNVLPKSLRIIC